MTFGDLMRMTPEATNAWNCKWFHLIVYLSLVTIACGLTIIPGILGQVAIAAGCLIIGFSIGTRRSDLNCKI